MRTITKKQLNKLPENPIFEGLTDEMKDPKNFEATEKKIASVMYSDHKHKNLKEFIKCERCQKKMEKKRLLIKELGFKDAIQYQNWKKVMRLIINQKPIIVYEK